MNTAYLHHHSDPDGNVAATFKRVALVHSKFKDEPFFSQIGYKFHLREGDDLLIAVQVENPLYLYDKANVHLTFHVSVKKAERHVGGDNGGNSTMRFLWRDTDNI